MTPFQNRKNELKLAWETLIWNWEHRDQRAAKQKLLLTGQMFGVGKTTFGSNLLNFENDHIANEFAKVRSSPGKEALRNALYIDIDFGTLHIPPGIKKFSDFLSYAVWMTAIGRFYDIPTEKADKFWRKKRYCLVDCINALQVLSQSQLYIHFDEIGALETDKYTQFFTPKKEDDNDLKRALRKYYIFWYEIFPLFSRGVFMYITGKSLRISELGMRKLALNEVKKLFLASFTVDDIADVLRADSQINICVNSDQISDLAKWLHEWSAGIPRLVVYGINGIVNAFAETKLTSMAMFNASVADKVVSAMATAPGALPDLGDNTDDIKDLMLRIFFAAASELVLDLDSAFPGFPNVTIQDLVDRFNIYTTPAPSGGVRLLMPKLWRKLIFEKIPELNFLKYVDAASTDKGKALESVTERMILFRSKLNRGTTDISEVFPFLYNRHTCLDGIQVGSPVSKFFNMSIINTTTAKDVLKYGILLEDSEKNVLLTFRAKSPSADLIILFPYLKGCVRRIMEIKCKNVESGFGIASLNAELAKGKVIREGIREGSQSSDLKTNVLFVLMLTGNFFSFEY